MADVERAVILEMASEALNSSKSPKPSSNSVSPTSTASDKLMNKNEFMKTCNLQGKSEETVSDKSKVGDVFEMRWKKDQGNSTDSPVKFSYPTNASHLYNGKVQKKIVRDQNQVKSWYEVLPFTQKRSPSQISTTDQVGKLKKTSPTSNLSTERNSVQNDMPVTSKQELDNCSSSNKLKQSGSNTANGQNILSKHADKVKCPSGNLSKPINYSDLQESPTKEKNHMKTEPNSNNLEEFSHQQHKKYQEQVKKYTKLKQKGKVVDQSCTTSQANEKVKEKDQKKRTHNHKHKDRSHSNTKKSSEANQCLNCQMKAQRFSLQEESMVDPPGAPITRSHVLSTKKNRNHQQSGSNGGNSHLSNNIPSVYEEEMHNSHNGAWIPTSEGTYVTFSHCVNPVDSHSFSQSSRNPQMVASSQQCLEKKDEKKNDYKDTMLATTKYNSNSKGNHFSQDINIVSGTCSNSKHFEKSLPKSDNLLNSIHSSLSLADSSTTQNMSYSSHIQKSMPKSTNNNISHYSTRGLNGLTFSGAPICYSGVNIPCKNTTETQELNSNRLNMTGRNGSVVTESVKRRDGGEYNNLSLDVQANSLHAHPVLKSYGKRVPWNGGNIHSELPPMDKEFLLCVPDQLSQLFNKKTDNQDDQEEKPLIFEKTPDVLTRQTKDYNRPTTSSTINIQAPSTGPEISALKVKEEKGEQSNAVIGQQLSPTDGKQNWQELLTTSHDYFEWKYRLCFDADDQDNKNSSPTFPLQKSNVKEIRSVAPSSQEVNNDSSAYVAFVSCPNILATGKHVTSSTSRDSSNLPNGKIHSPAFSMTTMNPSLCPSVNRFNEFGKGETTRNISRKTNTTTTSCSKRLDAPIMSIHSKPIDPFIGSDTNIKVTGENQPSANLMMNHTISTLSVPNGFKAAISPTTANHIYLPMSIANENAAISCHLTNEINSCRSPSNGNEASSVNKHNDYTKLSDAFVVSSKTATTTAPHDSGSQVASNNAIINGNCNSAQENVMRPSSLFVRQSEMAIAPKSLQKLFPSKFNTQGTPFIGKQPINNTEIILSPNGTLGSDEEKAILSVSAYDKRKVDTSVKKPFMYLNSISSNHNTPMSKSSNSPFKNVGQANHAIFNSTSQEMEKKFQPHSHSTHTHITDDKTHCNGRDSQISSSDSNTSNNNIFCVLPFEEYTADNCTPKFPSQCGPEMRKHPQYFHGSKTTSTNDHRTTAIHKRELKNSIQPNEKARYSSCSSYSINEIQIVKSTDAKDHPLFQSDIQESSGSHTSHRERKEVEKNEKKVDALQVRYTPKSGMSKKEAMQRAAISVTSTSSNSPLPSCIISDDMSFLTVPKTVCQPNITSDPHEMSSTSAYANEVLLSGSSNAGPDLLQVTVVQQGHSRKADSSSRQSPPGQNPTAETSMSFQPKKQSFLARLAHSPLSFLHRDSKNAKESK